MSTPETKIHPGSPFPDGTTACDAGSCARDRIFEAARRLFYKFGIRGVSVDAIAAEADTTKVTLYRVFDSKEQLICAVLEDQAQRFWRWWDSVAARYPGQPREQISALFSELSEFMEQETSERGCPLTNAAVEVVEEDHPARELLRKNKAEKVRRLRELCRELGARQPEALADALMLLVNGMFSTRVTSDGTTHVATAYDAALALVDSPSLGVPPKTKR
jgi:AcrR family transcriptional regulator